MRRLTGSFVLVAGLALAPAAVAVDRMAVLTIYADIAHAMYSDALAAATRLQDKIDVLAAKPSAETLAAARAAWIAARVPYQQTEGYRDVASGDGRIDVYGRDYEPIGGFTSGGIGPHQLAFSGDALVVANGGLLTHPDSGRRVLNPGTMRPSLVWLNPTDGRLLRRLTLPARWHQLSLRRLAVLPDGRVAVAAQHQGPGAERPPLLAIADPDGLDMVEVPDVVRRRWRNYAGSVAVDRSGEFCAVSHPRGGLVSLYRLDRPAFLGSVGIPEACGLAPDAEAGRFLVSDGHGGLSRLEAASGRRERAAVATLAWDNHLAAI